MSHHTHALCKNDQETLVDYKFWSLECQRKLSSDFVLDTHSYDGKGSPDLF